MAIQVGGQQAPESSGDFERELPDLGEHNAVCVDVHMMLGVEHDYGKGKEIKDELVFVFALGTAEGQFLHNTFEDKPGWVQTVRRSFAPFLVKRDGSGTKLFDFLNQWTGGALMKKYGSARAFDATNPELTNFIGRPGRPVVYHKVSGRTGKPYALFDMVLPLAPHMKALPLPPSGDQGYTRIKDREAKTGQQGGSNGTPGMEPDDIMPRTHAGAGATAPDGLPDEDLPDLPF